MKYRKRPVVIEATQWFKNGDHPKDGSELLQPFEGDKQLFLSEGKVVRYFRRPEPEYAGETLHDKCGIRWHEHGWIDTLEGGHTVCPKDWIITGVQGEFYSIKNDIFLETYEKVDS